MLKPIITLCFGIIFHAVITAQTLLPPIPEGLKENAYAIDRLKEMTFEIKNIGSATLKVKQIVTILNKNGESRGEFRAGYTPYRKISSINGIVIGSDGKVIKKLKRVDFADFPAFDGSSLFSDNRVLAYSPSVSNFPYTVEYEYEISFNGILNYPTWIAQNDPEVSVEKSFFKIIVPSDLPLRYKLCRADAPKISNVKNTKVYDWAAENMKAMEEEPYRTSMYEVSPVVYVAPEKFEFHDFEGDLSNWKVFGDWIVNLNKDRDQLPETAVSQIKELVKDTKDTVEMIRRIYTYMQNKTRYVGIQLGIGGYQPMLASDVDRIGYGDCKALSNYTIALLKAAGIKAYYVLVNAGTSVEKMDPKFSTVIFDHAIVTVPLSKESIWLECTSQTNPFGFMGSGTTDRDVLAITEKGGVIMHTPVYPAEVNSQNRLAKVNIDMSGDALADVRTSYCGIQFENVAPNLQNSPEDQKKWFETNNDIPVFQVLEFKYSKPTDIIPKVEETQKLQLNKYAGTNPRLFIISLNLMNKRTKSYKPLKQRKTDIEIDYTFTDNDTVIYTLPSSLKPETIPQNSEFSSVFGNYKSTVTVEGNTLTYIRSIRVNKCRYPAEKYAEFTEFFDKIVKADKCKAVFSKT